jgi:hypothetical protein
MVYGLALQKKAGILGKNHTIYFPIYQEIAPQMSLKRTSPKLFVNIWETPMIVKSLYEDEHP